MTREEGARLVPGNVLEFTDPTYPNWFGKRVRYVGPWPAEATEPMGARVELLEPIESFRVGTVEELLYSFLSLAKGQGDLLDGVKALLGG